MQKVFVGLLVGLSAIMFSSALLAADAPIPDLKGTWTGSYTGIKFGKGDPYNRTKEAELGKVSTIKINFIIDFQEGRVFSGTKSSDKIKERILGVISANNKNIWMADQDGYTAAVLHSPTKMEIIYMEVNPPVQVIRQGIFTRKP
jgi:hypothetical protein